MALITTVAGTSSDSYLSLSEANDLLWLFDHATKGAWTASKTDCKEDALKKATADLDSLLWDGVRSTQVQYIGDVYVGPNNYRTNRNTHEFHTDSQALEVPRDFMQQEDGTYVIPREVKYACMIQAGYHIASANSSSFINDAANAGVKKFRVEDGVEIELDGKAQGLGSSRLVTDEAFKHIAKFIRPPRILK